MSKTLETVGEPLIAVLILLGAGLGVLSTFGLIRLPEVYLRSHAATKSATLGVLGILSGTFLYFLMFEGRVSARLLLGIVFVFITAPVAGHLMGRAAYRTGVPLWDKSVRDDLKRKVDRTPRAEDEAD